MCGPQTRERFVPACRFPIARTGSRDGWARWLSGARRWAIIGCVQGEEPWDARLIKWMSRGSGTVRRSRPSIRFLAGARSGLGCAGGRLRRAGLGRLDRVGGSLSRLRGRLRRAGYKRAET